MNLLSKIYGFTLLFSIIASCNQSSEVLEYWEDKKTLKTKVVYPNKNDTSNYKLYKYSESGVVYYIGDFKKSKLLSYQSFHSNGKPYIEEEERVAEKLIKSKSDSMEITVMINICNHKEWTENGILIYETKIIPKNKMVIIKNDSLNKLISRDTIPY